MQLGLIGYGNMGRLVEQVALTQGHEVVCRITSTEKPWDQLDKADLVIDFSHASTVLENVKQCVLHHKPLVIGTTGWQAELPTVQQMAQEIGVLYAPNFSLGVHLFLKLLEHCGHLFNPFPDYEAAGIEIHHNQKKDAPSGTSLAMRDFLKKGLQRQTEMPLTSVRLGSITGKHTVLLDSPFDTLSITHEAKNKQGYALGALKTAEWLKEQNKPGFYTLDDLFLSN